VPPENASAVLLGALSKLLTETAAAPLRLEVDGVDAARATQASVVDQLSDYVLPRLVQLDAPVVVVVGGSTGAGKSTLVNSLVGERVTESGVLRPTTRSPVLVHNPGDAEWFERWRGLRMAWHQELGLNPDKLRWHPHVESELAHYARAAYDIEYEFPFGWNEIEGIHNRGDFDLSNHQKASGKKLEYFDQAANTRYLPNVVETSAGADRITLTVLADAFREEEVEGETRAVLGFLPSVAPIKAAVLPLVNKDAMPEMATELFNDIRKKFSCFYDDGGAIGRRYRRMDEVGTPFCITIDGQTATDQTVTVRHRDSMAQDRIAIDAVTRYLSERLV